MKSAVVLLGVLLFCYQSSGQNVTVVNINAIVPCQMNFTINPNSGANMMSSCNSYLPGTTLTAIDWPTCYLWCCPGQVQPPNSSYDDIQACISEFSQPPFLVNLIGIVLGIILLFLFVCLPCFFSKDPTFTHIKDAIISRFKKEGTQEEFIADPLPVNASKTREDLKNGQQLGSQYLLQDSLQRMPLSDEIIDDLPSQERICQECGEGKGNLRLSCGHCFHSQCLNNTGKLGKKCQECQSQNVFPIRAYCSICQRRYANLDNVSSNTIYICRTCDEK